MSLGENLKALMAQNRFTQKVLAAKSYCTEAAISRYVHDERKPNYKTLDNLALALGVSVDVLIKGKVKENMVRVVRCKDCKYAKPVIHRGEVMEDLFKCTYIKMSTELFDIDYCRYGRPKERGDKQ